jgi:hypothetical protein
LFDFERIEIIAVVRRITDVNRQMRQNRGRFARAEVYDALQQIISSGISAPWMSSSPNCGMHEDKLPRSLLSSL